jgi:anti-sigma factor RsiW
MACHYIDEQLDQYLDAELTAESRAAFEAHAAACEDCRERLAHAERLQRTLAALLVPGPTPRFFERAMARAATGPRVSHKWVGWAVGLAAAIALLAIAPLLERPALGPAPGGLSEVALTLNETRTVNLVFAAAEELEHVSLSVDLPAGVELARYPGLRRVSWTTQLKAGKNVLPLTLVASDGVGGELVATLRHDATQKTFRVAIAVMPG